MTLKMIWNRIALLAWLMVSACQVVSDTAAPVRTAGRGSGCAAPDLAIGSVDFMLERQSDGACIGTLGWPVIPQSQASIALKSGWCGPGCAQVTARSDPFDNRPELFRTPGGRVLRLAYHGETAVLADREANIPLRLIEAVYSED